MIPEVEVKKCDCGISVRFGNQTWCMPEEAARALFQALLTQLAELKCKPQ